MSENILLIMRELINEIQRSRRFVCTYNLIETICWNKTNHRKQILHIGKLFSIGTVVPGENIGIQRFKNLNIESVKTNWLLLK